MCIHIMALRPKPAPPSFSSIYLVLLSKLNTDFTNVYHYSSESAIILSLFSILLQSNPTLPHPFPAPLSLHERTWDLIQTKTVTYMPKSASLKENDWPYLPGWWIPDSSLKRGKAPLRYWASLLFPILSPFSLKQRAKCQHYVYRSFSLEPRTRSQIMTQRLISYECLALCLSH